MGLVQHHIRVEMGVKKDLVGNAKRQRRRRRRWGDHWHCQCMSHTQKRL